MMKKFSLFLVLVVAVNSLMKAQTDNGVMRMDEFRNPKYRKNIIIPDVDGYQTLKCDFHMHTIFSDGHVWPTVRVDEAWREGLDAISITDHVEYHKYPKDVVIDNNRAYELGAELAKEHNLIFIKGAEITRNTPPGHFNGLFIGDASDYIMEWDKKKDKEAIQKAADQNAFIIWNHPGWKVNSVEGSYEWIDFVDNLYQENILQGIEVFNGFGFHKKALDWCIDKGLTVLGNTDVHGVISNAYKNDDDVHRTMTLVFAKERSEASIREALEARRTVAWSSDYLAGEEENVRALFDACITFGEPYFTKNSKKNYEVQNNSDLYFHLKLSSGTGTKEVFLYPQSSQIIIADTNQSSLSYEVVNTYIRSDEHLIVDFTLE